MITDSADSGSAQLIESNPARQRYGFGDAFSTDYPDSFWFSLLLYNFTRIVITGGLMMLAWPLSFTNMGSHSSTLYFYAATLHLTLSIVFLILIKRRQPNFNWQLTQQVCTDVVLICVMIYASGGLSSGLGILLMISLAGAGLISHGRLTLFYAAIASIGILMQEVYTLLYVGSTSVQMTHAALHSMAYFMVAWLAQRLAARVIASEALVRERNIDLANMAQINQHIIRDLKEGILVVDNHNHIRQCNLYAGKLIDLPLQPDYFNPVKLSDHAPALAALVARWRAGSGLGSNKKPSSLRIGNALIRVRLIPIADGNNADTIIYLEDLSHIQTQVQQLKLAALGRLTANIAHEIRNPLSSINHAAELLREELFNDKTHNRLLRIINDNTQRLNKIVQDVLQLNRRDAAIAESLDVATFVRLFVDEFCVTEKIDIAVFELQLADSGPVRFDRNHLHQILWNLCRNAWRHCDRHNGSIVIQYTTQPQDGNSCLEISNDGPGITSQQQKQLFEPFFTTAPNGTGLGLYIARELCEANGASLEFSGHATHTAFKILFQSVHSGSEQRMTDTHD